MNNKRPPDTYIAYGRAVGLGFFMVGSIVGCFFIGDYLDSRFGTTPKLMLVFVLLGIAAGFMEFYRVLKRLSDDKRP
ncbi:MAG: AtpZ/AtpI family protein [Candidatus Brocadiales bacterium]